MNAIERTIPRKEKELGFLNRLNGKILVSFGILFTSTILTVFLVLAFGIPFTDIKSLYKAEESKALRELELVSHLKKERLERWLKERRDNIRLLSKSEMIKEHARKFIRENESSAMTLDDLRNDENHKLVMHHFLQTKNAYGVYESIAISDMKGRVILSTNPLEMGADVSKAEFFLAPLRNLGEVYQEVDYDIFGEGDWDLYISQAMKDWDSDKTIGVLFARIQNDDFINPLLHVGVGLGVTGETMLLSSERKILIPLKFSLPDGSKALPLGYEDTSKAAILATDGEEGTVATKDYRGVPVLASYHYLRISSESSWGFIVKQDRSEIMAGLDDTMRVLSLVFLFSSLFLGLIAYFISRKLTRPIEHLTGISTQVKKGDFSTRAFIISNDETGELAITFNDMLATIEEEIRERKRVEEKLTQRTIEVEDLNRGLEERVLEELAKSREKDFTMMQQARLASMGEMLGNIAHQWRQPLNGLGLIIQGLRDARNYGELDDAYIEETVRKSMKLIDFMSQTIDDFRNFFRKEHAKTSFNVLEAIRDTLFLIHQQLLKQGISLTLRCGERSWELTSTDSFRLVRPGYGECLFVGYSNEFKQALLNFVMNSRDAILSMGKKTGRIAISHWKENGLCHISIEDNGGGIPPELLDKVFDPYFSTKDEGKGTGIGLYMSRIIIEEHMEGEITVENTGEGARFTITFKQETS